MEGIDKNTFKRLFHDHWDAFKQFRPRFDNPDYNETVNKMLGCGNPKYKRVLTRLKSKLKAFQKRTKDPWIVKWQYE